VEEILRRGSQAGAAAAEVSKAAAEESEARRKKREEEEELQGIVNGALKWSEDFDKQWSDFKQKFDQLFELGAQKLGESLNNTPAGRAGLRPVEQVDEARVAQILRRASRLVVLTGAGVSAESGIPTFRGADGYWTVGSENYRPQELATWKKFDEMPEELWRWYQYRWGVCTKASTNPGHHALVDLEGSFQGDFLLVTQNIDGLHKQAGSDPARLCEIHGRIDQMRCDERVEGSCLQGVDLDDPANFELVNSTIYATPEPAEDEQAECLPKCHRCGVRQRPKILWFDETYNEAIYKHKTVMRATEACDVLLIVGTQLTTGLPNAMVRAVRCSGAAVLRIDPLFDADESAGMLHLQAKSGESLPRVIAELRELQKEPHLAPLATAPSGIAPQMQRTASRPSVKAKAAPKAAPKSMPRNLSSSRASSSRSPSAAGRSPGRSSSGSAALRAAGAVSLGGGATQVSSTPERQRVRSASRGPRGAADGAVAGFFVYGTLRPDDNSGATWTKSFCEGLSAEVATLPGASLYFPGSYPAVCFEQTRCAVRGVLLTPSAQDAPSAVMEAKLSEADRIEGYPDLYDRAVATVYTASGLPQLAYVYHRTGRFERELSDRIADGDWLSRRR